MVSGGGDSKEPMQKFAADYTDMMSGSAKAYWGAGAERAYVPEGFGICHEPPEYCIKAPWDLWKPRYMNSYLSHIFPNAMLFLASILMKAIWGVLFFVGMVWGYLFTLGKRVRMESAITRKGARLMYTIRKEHIPDKRTPTKYQAYELDEDPLETFVDLYTSQMTSDANDLWGAGDGKKYAPKGLGICTESPEYCIKKPWDLWRAVYSRNPFTSLMLLVTNVIMVVSWFLISTVASVWGFVFTYGKRVRLEMCITRHGARMMYILNEKRLPRSWKASMTKTSS